MNTSYGMSSQNLETIMNQKNIPRRNMNRTFLSSLKKKKSKSIMEGDRFNSSDYKKDSTRDLYKYIILPGNNSELVSMVMKTSHRSAYWVDVTKREIIS